MANSEGVALLAIEKLDEIFYVVKIDNIYIYIYLHPWIMFAFGINHIMQHEEVFSIVSFLDCTWH